MVRPRPGTEGAGALVTRHGKVDTGLALAAGATLVYWLAARAYSAERPDFFYLADAFLRGQTWLDATPAIWDVIIREGRAYVPFGPFPAIAFTPLVAVVGPGTASAWEPLINAGLAGASVGLLWWLLARIGIEQRVDRLWLVLLFGFSTQVLWVTARGGVWHAGHLFALLLTFGVLLELWGKRRAWLIGLLAGAALLTRAPLALAIPFYALALLPSEGIRRPSSAWVPSGWGRVIIERWLPLALGVAPSIAFFLLYNQARFGSPLESGYALATVTDFLERQRQLGLFSFAHVPMNIDYFLLKVPGLSLQPPFITPDRLGMSVLITSPGLLYAVRANWRDQRAWWMAGAALAVLGPTLLYYGGGWIQYGYRYFLDSVPFVMALCGMAAAYRGRIGIGWKVLFVVGVLVMAMCLYWVPRL